VLDILREGFDPIIDQDSGADLCASMVYARTAEAWDFSNMCAALLRYRGQPVVAAVFRVMGTILLEIPLIATKKRAQRQGHARCLLDGLSVLLHPFRVEQFLLPAHDDALATWIHGFGFAHVTDDELHAVRAHMRMVLFPATTVLKRPVTGIAQPFVARAAPLPVLAPPAAWPPTPSALSPLPGVLPSPQSLGGALASLPGDPPADVLALANAPGEGEVALSQALSALPPFDATALGQLYDTGTLDALEQALPAARTPWPFDGAALGASKSGAALTAALLNGSATGEFSLT